VFAMGSVDSDAQEGNGLSLYRVLSEVGGVRTGCCGCYGQEWRVVVLRLRSEYERVERESQKSVIFEFARCRVVDVDVARGRV